MDFRGGWVAPPDREHIEKYPVRVLSLLEMPSAPPMTIGIPWYRSFMEDQLVKRDRIWYIKDASGGVLGGHAICVPSQWRSDRDAWRKFYNQRDTGECVGYSTSRMMTILNRERYDAPWLYFNAQDNAGQPRDDQAGTYLRSAGEVLRLSGHKEPLQKDPQAEQGIAAYRWAQNIDDMRRVLQSPIHDKRNAFPLLNSWGMDYPHVVWMPYEVAEQVIFQQDGEAMVVTDR